MPMHRCLLIAAFMFPVATHAADRPVKLQVPPPVAKGAAAMPLIANPADDAERRIDTAVQRLDGALRKAIAGCRHDGGKDADWERSIDVPMRGPGFISYVITDTTFCGGAYPSTGTMAIVYDLRTGAPVDWTRLLPPALTGTVALQAGQDGTKMVTLSSKPLYAAFLAGYDKNHAKADDAECRDAVRQDDSPAMMAWPDAKQGGLAVQFDLIHAVEACADPVVIPVATLRAAGAAPTLLDAITSNAPPSVRGKG